LYSFLNASAILRKAGDISPDEWSCYLRGSSNDFSSFPNEVEYITEKQFYGLLGLEEAHFSFKDISKSFADPGDAETWKRIMLSEEPRAIPLPPLFEDRLSAFQKNMLLKVLREGKLMQGVKAFV